MIVFFECLADLGEAVRFVPECDVVNRTDARSLWALL
jgi:hypothetical protein